MPDEAPPAVAALVDACLDEDPFARPSAAEIAAFFKGWREGDDGGLKPDVGARLMRKLSSKGARGSKRRAAGGSAEAGAPPPPVLPPTAFAAGANSGGLVDSAMSDAAAAASGPPPATRAAVGAPPPRAPET